MAPNLLKYALNMGDMRPEPIRSKVMFGGKYKEALENLMEILEEMFEWAEAEHFVIDSVIPGNNNIRLRITETEMGEQIIVNCVFWYHHNDQRYGLINIDLVTTGYKQKTKTHFVGTFGILDHENIKTRVCNDLITSVAF